MKHWAQLLVRLDDTQEFVIDNTSQIINSNDTFEVFSTPNSHNTLEFFSFFFFFFIV